MKLRFVLFFAFLAGLLAIGVSSASNETAGQQIGGAYHLSEIARARCGLSLELTIQVKDGIATVEAAGAPGENCDWIDMEITFAMRDAETGEWVYFPGYEGQNQTWNSTAQDYTGFDMIMATGIAHDEQAQGLPCNGSGLMRGIHEVSLSVHN